MDKKDFEVPYRVNIELSDTDDTFFGREREMDSLYKHIIQNNTKITILFGSRKIGKSSLVNMFIGKKVSQENLFPIKINMNQLAVAKDVNDFYDKLLEKLHEELVIYGFSEEDLPQLPVVVERKENLMLRNYLFDIIKLVVKKEQKDKILLIFDDCDVLFSLSESVSELKNLHIKLIDFFQRLDKIQLLICGGVDTYEFKQQSIGPLAPFPMEILSNLSQKDATILITEPIRGIFSYEEDAISLILEKSGGNPNFLQYFCRECCLLVKNKGLDVIKKENVLNIYNESLSNERSNDALTYSEVLFNLIESGKSDEEIPHKLILLKILAQASSNQGLSISNIREILNKEEISFRRNLESELTRLVQYGIIYFEGSIYYISIGYFKDWISKFKPNLSEFGIDAFRQRIFKEKETEFSKRFSMYTAFDEVRDLLISVDIDYEKFVLNYQDLKKKKLNFPNEFRKIYKD